MTVNTLAENIRYYREQHGWTQKELAQKINISRSVLSKWENGQLIPDLQAVIQLSELFEVSIDFLVGKVRPPQQLLREMKERYQLADEEVDKELVDIIRYLTTHKELKSVLFQLAHLKGPKRKAVEDILKVVLDKLQRI
ncbi:helix-turn-helix domain protein [Caldalkalibacillus thermarum TA2.A1]|uniref:Helix-turn-helix domain protein n=1 Tax=Caldalkalibacillus thermarum (strain TA2.A1) TaxID=986075 RepID=F5L477_CALTT|nr:helix-turn-helix transcriptional regulator [Caldalkalibacillus thermarum]EGL83865.1 helix-turn-helix domain protein [Caldalkalibacillus thermarum TA2.A1]QZT34218.1 helix-turn-helix transcriptional regulator [Caldalkalibacillus thermarum TA2.A1]